MSPYNFNRHYKCADFDDCDCHFGDGDLPPPKFHPISDNDVGDSYGDADGEDYSDRDYSYADDDCYSAMMNCVTRAPLLYFIRS